MPGPKLSLKQICTGSTLKGTPPSVTPRLVMWVMPEWAASPGSCTCGERSTLNS
jgi:hypothetical protein